VSRYLKRFFVLAVFLLSAYLASAQPYANEWIVPGQDYYKILTYENGMYAVTGQDLQDAGIQTGSWTSNKIQLWHRGVQQSVMITGAEDGKFDSADSLIFYGRRNDGTLDSLLYNPYSAQPHKYFNLHSDTCAYFLTQGVENGKRMQLMPSSGNGNPVLYHYAHYQKVFTQRYEEGERYGDTRSSHFNRGEGWTGNDVVKSGTGSQVLKTFDIPLRNVNLQGGYTSLEVVVMGGNIYRHNIEILAGNPSAPDYRYQIDDFEGNTHKKVFIPISSDKLTDTSYKVSILVKGHETFEDRVSVALISLRYPQNIVLGSNETNLSLAVTGASKILAAGASRLCFDITDNSSLKLYQPNSSGKYILSGATEKLILMNFPAYRKPFAIRKANLRGYTLSNANLTKASFIIITHSKFIKPAKEYASYRKSTAGGGNDTLVANIADLYDNFSYGEITPLAVKNFCRLLADKGKPEYLFIIGRGMDVQYNHFFVGKYYRFEPGAYSSQVNTWNYIENFVPFAGTPTSDIVYVSGIGTAPEGVPAFPVGRLNAKYEADVYAYLNKVILHESLPGNELWRKNVLHLTGGKTEAEIIDLKGKLQNLQPIVTDSVFAGMVEHIVKPLGSVVDEKLIETVAQKVNKGLSYITFLGHASPSVPDIDIGFVSNPLYKYQNKGKFPMLIMNGCNTFTGLVPYSLSEDWLVTPDKGGLMAMGHSHYGYSSLMTYYTRVFYENAFNKRSTFENNLSVGQIQIKVIEELAGDNSYFINAMNQQMFLQGDPAIRMYSPAKPDFSITASSIISLDGQAVTAVSDSFAIAVTVANYGLSTKDSLVAEVKRTIGQKTYSYRYVFWPAPANRDTLIFTIRRGEEDGSGMNSFTISLDPYNGIAETNELNNSFTVEQYLPFSIVKPLFPSEFSIVNRQPVNFTAQGSNLLQGEKDYLIELDTTAYFSSSFRKSAVIRSGPLVKWNNISLLSDVPANDSIVYFWRVRYKDIAPGEDTVWGTSSFIYIKNGPEGWSQSNLSQLKKDETEFLSIDDIGGKMNFDPTETTISVGSPGTTYKGPDKNKTFDYWAQLAVNGEPIVFEGRGGCRTGVFGLAFDKSTLVPYFPVPETYRCGYDFASKRVNSFFEINISGDQGGPQTQEGLIKYIDRVKSGDYVLLMTSGNASFSSWKPSLKTKMKEAFGARLLDSLSDNMPYIILARKDSKEPLAEITGSSSEKISLDYNLTGKSNKGQVSTPLIGPSSEWKTLIRNFEPQAGDQYKVSLKGIDLSGNEDTLIADVTAYETDISEIDPLKYPYLRLVADVYDSTNLTPLAFDKWQVIYSNVPEGTINTELAGKQGQYSHQYRQEGEVIRYDFAFTNISDKGFPEKLKAVVSVKNQITGRVQMDTITLVALKPDSTVGFSYEFSSKGWIGENKIQAFVNPSLQAEQYYQNNIIEAEFAVNADKLNPVLDVTVDGNHIMDGEIVSPSPMIVVSLKDENKVLIMNDTSSVDLFLKGPCSGCQFEKISLNNSDIISWGQASAGVNNFKIEYNPKNLKDGIYTLRVQGSDVSGNKSGSQAYEVTFEVINESAVTNIYPYPNPFSTSTRFVFTITGSKIPEDMKIQIMTVTGKVVREINKAELGPLKIGNNRTEYAWDGKDEFGDQLANGVYLYKVEIKGQEDFTHRKTAGDKAFKKNFGKIYLLK
jgi:hypothetical protein